MAFLTSALQGLGGQPVSCNISFTAGEGASSTHWIGGLVDPRASLDTWEKRKCPFPAPARNQS